MFKPYFLSNCIPVLDVSSWLLVLVTVNRLLVVWFPLSTRWRFKSAKVITAEISTVLLICMCMNCHFLTVEWSNKSPYIQWGETSLLVGCTTSNAIYLEFLHTWLMVHFVFSTILPFFFLILSNCLIIGKVVQNNLRRQERLNVSSKVKDNKQLPGMAAMLLTVSFSYIQVNLDMTDHCTTDFWL